MPDHEVLIVDDEGGVRTMTLNRPHVLNAVDLDLARAIDSALTEADARPDIQVVILAGSGRAFCAGADLQAFADRGERPEIDGKGFAAIATRERATPLIAAVEGIAFGGGFELCLAADLVVAGEGARFALPEVRWSVLAAGGGLLRLGRSLPTAVVMEIALTGTPISAARGQVLGLVNRVVPAGSALEEAGALAREIRAAAPLAVAATRRIVLAAASGRAEAEVWQLTGEEMAKLVKTKDYTEGPLAFADKRPPRWTGG
jgi:enoyl-CoA hydratase